jgi:hypothetical protein
MASIAFMTEHSKFPWQRQLTERTPLPSQHRFTINQIDPDCDFLVVYDDIGPEFQTTLPRERRLAILNEPPGVKTYRPSFLAQFGSVLGPINPNRSDVVWIKSHPALAWYYGVGFAAGRCSATMSFKEIATTPPPEKTQTVSVVISTKTRLPMHRQRISFVTALKARLGDQLFIYGNGFTPIPDKADAINPHAYHLVLENNDMDHFWTEKTADAFLGWSLPLFSGCQNLSDYFPEPSFIPITLSNISAAVQNIEHILREQPYTARLPAIAQARQRLVTEHELSACLRKAALTIPADTTLHSKPMQIRANRNLGPTGLIEPFARKIARRVLRRPS